MGCKTTPYANSLFEQPWWLDIVAPGEWGEIIVHDYDRGGASSVVARLPYVMKNGRIKLPYYTQTLGMWMDETIRNEKRGNDHLSSQKEVIRQLLKQLPNNKGIDFVFDSSVSYILPFRWEGFRIEPTFSYRIKDLSDVERIERNFSKGIRRDINKGRRTLLLDDSPDSINEFILLQNQTYKRQNRKNPIDNAFTENVIRQSINEGHGKLLLARDHDGNAHAGSFAVYDESVCYHLMSGQDTSFGNDCAMPFLMYHEIMFAREVSQSFDFEGSMVEGIEQVYRRYGGEQVINWHVTRELLLNDVIQLLKPRIKKIIGYKI